MLNSKVASDLRDAIATVRFFAKQAEMVIERAEKVPSGCDPEMIIGQVQAKLAWGLANASSAIGDALSTVVSEREQNNGH